VLGIKAIERENRRHSKATNRTKAPVTGSRTRTTSLPPTTISVYRSIAHLQSPRVSVISVVRFDSASTRPVFNPDDPTNHYRIKTASRNPNHHWNNHNSYNKTNRSMLDIRTPPPIRLSCASEKPAPTASKNPNCPKSGQRLG
jgi:hypothetical protein